jgi:peptide-methionine (S)-S-oxide reductase
MSQTKEETAILAGGCFWCLEAVYVRVRGVLGVESGYCGGAVVDPTYAQVCSGQTGHAEAVRIRFDPARIGFRDLLEIFFLIHDPTTRNRQGNDVGSQYRSAIFWTSPEQQAIALSMTAELDAARVYAAPIVTELQPAPTFYAAEAYHQGYFETHPDQPYCEVVVAPKLAKFRAKLGPRFEAD